MLNSTPTTKALYCRSGWSLCGELGGVSAVARVCVLSSNYILYYNYRPSPRDWLSQLLNVASQQSAAVQTWYGKHHYSQFTTLGYYNKSILLSWWTYIRLVNCDIQLKQSLNNAKILLRLNPHISLLLRLCMSTSLCVCVCVCMCVCVCVCACILSLCIERGWYSAKWYSIGQWMNLSGNMVYW